MATDNVTLKNFANGSWFFLVGGCNFGPYTSAAEALIAAKAAGFRI